MGETVKLPRWRSHKIVEAAKVTGVSQGGLFPHWHLEGGGSVLAQEMLATRVPRGLSPVGGYYVRYPDGFQSWSPAPAFEEGYTRVDTDG